MNKTKKAKNQISYNNRSIYKLPRDYKNYVIFLREVNILDKEIFEIKQIRDFRKYMTNNFQQKMLILKYFINDKNINIEEFFKNYRCDLTGMYKSDNLNKIFEDLKSQGVEILEPKLNLKNTNLKCCNSYLYLNSDLIEHAKTCNNIRFQLWNEKVPKDLKKQQNKKNINVTINNNNTQNIYHNYVSFRQTGDFIRSKLSVEQKRDILNSIDKVGELVKLHFQYDEVKNNIVLKNISPYKSCEVFNGKCFIFVNNKECFRYYVLDQLDTLDYFAVVDVKDPVLTRRLEKYDENIRKNDKNMMAMINKTMLQVKGHINKLKQKENV